MTRKTCIKRYSLPRFYRHCVIAVLTLHVIRPPTPPIRHDEPPTSALTHKLPLPEPPPPQPTTMLTFGQWINNKETPSLDSATIDVENPSDGSIVGRVPAGCAADAEAALAAAKKAQPAWAKTPVGDRAKVLKGIATVIRENREDLFETLISEQSKVQGLAEVEIDATANYYDYYAGLAYSWEGEIIQSDNVGENIYLHYAPIGVSVGIAPWNFPFFVVSPVLL